MAKADVLQLVDEMALNQVDATIIEGYYADAIVELAVLGFFSTITLIEVTKDQGVYAFPEKSTNIVEAFYDDTILYRETVNGLQAEVPNWRDASGRPVAFTSESETARTLRLYPVPDLPSRDFSFLLGSPMGTDFPEYAIGAILNETVTDAQDYLDLVLAFLILSKEYKRESDHTDFRFADLCAQFADFILGVI
jgi:hypothetical protein